MHNSGIKNIIRKLIVKILVAVFKIFEVQRDDIVVIFSKSDFEKGSF